MKITRRGPDTYLLRLNEDELRDLAAVLEDYSEGLSLRYEDQLEASGYKPIADRTWDWSCDMDRALEGARRWWWDSPRALSRPWLPALYVATDEYCNPTITMIVPGAGAFTVRYARGPLRTTECDDCTGGTS